MTKALGVLALAGVAGMGVASAGSSTAQMSVSVTVVRSCAIDASALLHLTCTAGARSNLRISEKFQPAAAVVSDGSRIITLNF